MQDFLDFAEKLSSKAGEMIKAGFSMQVQTNWKADNTPLTETDTTINSMVIEAVKAKFPDHGILGEEEEYNTSEAEYVWVCDPIDGTLPFSHGLNISTFSLALTQNGIPIVGVVFDPFQNLLYKASVEEATTLNGERVRVSEAESLASKVVCMDGIGNSGELYAGVKATDAWVFSPCSFVYGAKMVASGHFAGAIFGKENPWDSAALKILIEQAGGRTSDVDGNSQRYDKPTNGFVGSNGRVHEQLLKTIRQANYRVKK